MDVEQVERLIDEAGDECVPVVAALVEMYGDGLARIVGSLAPDAVAAAAQDPLVAHLLILHDLHPVSVDNRVREAVAGTGAYAVVVEVEGGIAKVRATQDKQGTIAEAIARAVPDVEAVEFEEPLKPVVVLPQVSA